MKVIPDFENELKAIHRDLVIIPNPNRQPNEENRHGISNIKLFGQDICPIPSEEIYDEPNDTYGYIFPRQIKMSRFKTRPEALAHVYHIIETIKTPEGSDAFMGKNEFDDKKK